jgi:acyl transferase domain-containing protein
MSHEQEPDAVEAVAIIGMAGRFPKAGNLEELWANLRHGADCIQDLGDDDLRESGLDPASLPPNYVKCAATVDGIELFDAGFFGFSPREAEILDPQSRLFLECAWEALESAGYVSESYPGWTGVFAGVSLPAT